MDDEVPVFLLEGLGGFTVSCSCSDVPAPKRLAFHCRYGGCGLEGEARLDPLRVFIGYDPRQPIAYNVCAHSVVRHASVPVSITPLILSQLPLKRTGLTEFTYSRFLVPWLCGFRGPAVFMDPDVVVTGDIKELFDQADPLKGSVHVMQEQPKFEWASVMLFNTGCCLKLTPEFVEDKKNDLFDLKWAGYVAELSEEWNHCVSYQEPKIANLYHFTAGIPVWYETRGFGEDLAWQAEAKAMNHTVPWKDLMGNSVHADATLKRMFKRLTA